MQWMSRNLFTLAAGVLLGASAVGTLKAAQTLMGITHILFQGLENVVPVRAAWHLRHGGREALVHYLRKIALVFGLVTAAIGIVAAAAPEFWLGLVFGEEYGGYGFLLQWFAVIYFIVFLGLPLHAGLRALERTRDIYSGYVWMTVFSVVFTYPMVEFLGLNGVVTGITAVNLILITMLFHRLKTRLS